MGHAIAVVALYHKPPKSVVIRRDGSGVVNWSFPVQSVHSDSVIYAAGPAADIIRSRPIVLRESDTDDFNNIKALGVDISIAMSSAMVIISRNLDFIDEYLDWFLPRPESRYRLIISRDLTWMVDVIK